VDVPFQVTNQNLGFDPLPDVYKYLALSNKNGLHVIVGENDFISEGGVAKIFTDFSTLPLCKQMQTLPSAFMKNKIGLEIGGPSMFSVRATGIYSQPRVLHNLHLSVPPFNISGERLPGQTFKGCITNIPEVFQPNVLDFTFVSHVLEHVQNPLRAFAEMRRVIKPGGHCILVVPQKEANFNHRRPTTTFAELVEHFDNKDGEEDIMAHITPKLLETYDFTKDPGAGTQRDFIERCKNHDQNRLFHVHVYDFALLKRCLEFSGFRCVYMQLVEGGHQVVVGQKK
jgi:SAM-dependent methyltransferase